MRRKKLYGVWLIITALVIMQLPVPKTAAATDASDFKMEGTTLVKYRGTEESVSIPNTVEVIGRSAFEGNEYVEELIIPNSVTAIEPYAFWDCNSLDTVVLGRGLKEIGDFAFASAKDLKSISIPSNIQTIGIQAFADCVNLTDITIPASVTSIHETAFDGCFKLEIHAEEGSYAYDYAQEFYERQEEMPEYEDVVDYDDEDEEDEDEGDTVDSSNASYGLTKVVGNTAVIFVDNTDLTVYDGNGNKVGEEAPATKDENDLDSSVVAIEDNEIPKYTIVDGKIVADQAYYRNKKLTEVSLPDGITEIGQFAFARSSIEKIEIPDGVRTIGYGAFYHCDDLKTVNLPDTVETVEPKAFLYTEWLESFMESGSEDYLISGDILVAYRGTEDIVEIPDGVRMIVAEAFANHTEIKRVIMSEELEIIGEGAFEGCSNLSKVLWGKNLECIKDRAFAGCDLNKVNLPDSIQKMGLGAFDDTVEVKMNDGVTIETTHELSAERLSNEAYRVLDKAEGFVEIGVTVTGSEGVFARLAGASNAYTLHAVERESYYELEKAYNRSYDDDLPDDIIVYDLTLTDSSNVPLTKLGKHTLTVSIQLPEELRHEGVRVITLDRNGQLEYVPSDRVLVENRESVRFETYHLSLFGIYGTGEDVDEELLEETNDFQALSQGLDNGASSDASLWTPVKYSVAAVVFVWGVLLLVLKRKSI